MNERQKRIKRITDINEYRERRQVVKKERWKDLDRGALERILKDIQNIKE